MLEYWSVGSEEQESRLSVVNELAFKLENGLLKLIESLERKKLDGDWVDSLIIEESNERYGGSE